MTWRSNRNSHNESGQISLKKYNSEISIYHKELPVSLIFFLIILMLKYIIFLIFYLFILILKLNINILFCI